MPTPPARPHWTPYICVGLEHSVVMYLLAEGFSCVAVVESLLHSSPTRQTVTACELGRNRYLFEPEQWTWEFKLSKNLRMTPNISRGTRRTYLTHVALVCDDPSTSCSVYMRAARDPHSIPFLAPASAVRCYEPHVFGARSRFQSRQPDNAVQSFRAKRGPLFALWLYS